MFKNLLVHIPTERSPRPVVEGSVSLGGYGHSRPQEFVFGGVTREMLRSMTVPTLMSH
jgi:nucleotide-binding universal stress UspA family protein